MTKNICLPKGMNSIHKSLLLSSFYAFCISCVILLFWFYPADFSIPKGSVPLIGQASKNNALVASRINLFYKLTFFGAAIWILLTLLLQRVYYTFFSSAKQYSNGLYYAIPILPYTYLATTGSEVQSVIFLLLGVFVIYFLRCIIFNFSYFSKPENKIPISFELTLGFVFLFHILLQFLFGHVTWFQEKLASILLITLIILQIKLFFLRKLINHTSIKLILLSSAGVPFLVFVAIEIQALSLEKGWFIFGYKKIYFLLQLLWIGFSLLIFKLKKTTISGITKKLFLPSLIFGYSLLVLYQPIIQPVKDFFELANSANSVMRTFLFGEIPILDYMSSHMFNEQWYGYLYNFIFGSSEQVEFTIYYFLNEFIFFLIIYFILIKVGLNIKSACIFIFFFPIIYEVFFDPVIYIFLVLFLIIRLAKSPTSLNVFYLLLILLFLILWRIDTGVAAVFSTFVFAPLFFWITKIKIPFNSLLKGFGLFLCLSIGLFIIALVLRPWEIIWTNFLSALHYVKGSQAHGYDQIFDGSFHQFYVIHFLFVAVAIILIVISSYTIRIDPIKNKISTNYWLIFSIFSFVIFLANAQRGLVRHGFAEQNELFFLSTFYLGLAFFCIHFIQYKKDQFKFAIFFYILFFTFIVTRFFPFLPKQLNSSKWIKSEAFVNLNSTFTKDDFQGRVIEKKAFEKEHFGEIKKYLNTNLKPNETFIDFSNSPMLYYYCQRKVPGYFNQNLQNTIDEFLQSQLIKSFEKNSVPIVIFSSYPSNWFDASDGILNTVRYFKIADYIFENYKPIGVLNKHSIFGLKNRNWENIPKKDTVLLNPINIDLGFLAGWEGNKYKIHEIITNQLISQEINLKVNIDSFATKFVIDQKLIGKSGVKVILQLHSKFENYSNKNQSSIIFRDSLGREVHRVQFLRDDNQFSMYAFPISNYYFWHQYSLLTFEFSENTGIDKVFFIKE
jgi:hypothetical protein